VSKPYQLTVGDRDFGARVLVRDLTPLSLDPEMRAELQGLLDKHLVLHITSEADVTAQGVGELAFHLGYKRNPENPYAFARPFRSASARPASAPDMPEKPGYLQSYHYDGISNYSVQAEFNSSPRTPNMFVSMRHAYRDLPRELKQIADKSWALHAGMATPQTPYDELPKFDAAPPSRRPMVIKHFRTGEPLLHLPKNPDSKIEGMSDAEGRAILAEFWTLVNRSTTRMPVAMKHNEVVVWDGMGTMHTNPAYPRNHTRTIWFFIIPATYELQGHSV
jgi:Taurine catabolism dioxygenase TauD, TfdA family